MTLTPEDCEAILRDCPAVRTAAPVVRARTQVVYGNRNWVPSSIYGTTPAFLDVRDWAVAEGEAFTERDVLNGNRVCLLGQTLVRELFEGDSPIGKEIRVKNVSFRVVGVLASKGANMMGMDQDDILLAPWTTIKYRVTGSTLDERPTRVPASSYRHLGEHAEQPLPQQPAEPLSRAVGRPGGGQPDAGAVHQHRPDPGGRPEHARRSPGAIDQMTQLLHERHHIRPGEADDFTIRDMTEMSKTLSSTTRLMTNLLLCVALISLVVGGVGIMNIMLVSVTERTREIGLRMAVGARARDILRQFLVEAVVLCLVGGAMGILLGHGGSTLVRRVLALAGGDLADRHRGRGPGLGQRGDRVWLSIRRGRPRGWTRSRPCATSDQRQDRRVASWQREPDHAKHQGLDTSRVSRCGFWALCCWRV